MSIKVGFIGCGNMGLAILRGILDAGIVDKSDVTVSCKSSESNKRLSETYGVNISDNRGIVRECDVVFLAIKPYNFPEVIGEIRGELTDNRTPLFISIAAGVTIDRIEELFEGDIKLIRAMPNTPALVGEAMSALVAGVNVSDDDKKLAYDLFCSFGAAEYVDEKLMDSVTAVSGSSPAYVYMMIEAMADGALMGGMPRDKAYKFAAQSVMGAAKMVLESGKLPAQLRDEVCSPAGTTIEAVAVLENKGFRDAIISAEKACMDRSLAMASKER